MSGWEDEGISNVSLAAETGEFRASWYDRDTSLHFGKPPLTTRPVKSWRPTSVYMWEIQ